MKSVLVSIKPRHTANILAGLKTVELRKTGPGTPPFKAYVYETLDGGKGAGAVVCEFICDKYCGPILNFRGEADKNICEAACVSQEDVVAYANGGNICGWHISDLVIYEDCKPLKNFCLPPERTMSEWKSPLKRPPQSWCYAEELKWL